MRLKHPPSSKTLSAPLGNKTVQKTSTNSSTAIDRAISGKPLSYAQPLWLQICLALSTFNHGHLLAYLWRSIHIADAICGRFRFGQARRNQVRVTRILHAAGSTIRSRRVCSIPRNVGCCRKHAFFRLGSSCSSMDGSIWKPVDDVRGLSVRKTTSAKSGNPVNCRTGRTGAATVEIHFRSNRSLRQQQFNSSPCSTINLAPRLSGG